MADLNAPAGAPPPPMTDTQFLANAGNRDDLRDRLSFAASALHAAVKGDSVADEAEDWFNVGFMADAAAVMREACGELASLSSQVASLSSQVAELTAERDALARAAAKAMLWIQCDCNDAAPQPNGCHCRCVRHGQHARAVASSFWRADMIKSQLVRRSSFEIANDPEMWRQWSWSCIYAEIEAAAARHRMPIRVAMDRQPPPGGRTDG